MSTSSKQVFIEYFQRNILCSPGRHIVSADPVTMYHVTVRLRTLAKITDQKLTAVSIRKRLICTQFIKDNLDVSKVFITSSLNSGRFSVLNNSIYPGIYAFNFS